jgi:ADP-heptose:LPS heptosyltransferase
LRLRQIQPSLLHLKYPAVIFGNAAGDQLLVLPALRALTSLFPSRLSLICMPGFRRTFFSDLRLRSVCEVEMQRRERQRVFDAAAVARRVGKCDMFLSLNPWHSVSLDRLVAFLSPAVSVGFSPAFQVALPKRSREHAAESAFRVPSYLDPSLRLDDFAIPPRLPDGASALIRRFLKRAAPGKQVLAVHNETKAEKMWPPDLLSNVVTTFLERHPEFVIFILDFRNPKLKIGKLKDRVIHSRGLPLPYAFALLQESDLFLGADSCMLHAADLFRIPGVGLFGPTEPRRWGFRFSPHRHVCDRRGLKFIPETVVLEALESLLPSGTRPPRGLLHSSAR